MLSKKLKRPEPFIFTSEKVKDEKDAEDVFHFVSYIHFGDKVLELDGLQEEPIVIAENVERENWLAVARESLIKRIEIYSTNEVKFNLMVVVPSLLDIKEAEEKTLLSDLNDLNVRLGQKEGDVDVGN